MLNGCPLTASGEKIRVGLNLTERGFGLRAVFGCSDRAHSAASQLMKGDIDLEQMFGVRGEEKYVIRDDESYLTFFFDLWKTFEQNKDLATLTQQVLKNAECWGRDLNEISGFSDIVCKHVDTILAKGMAGALKNLR